MEIGLRTGAYYGPPLGLGLLLVAPLTPDRGTDTRRKLMGGPKRHIQPER
jgi:hypothetical protein